MESVFSRGNRMYDACRRKLNRHPRRRGDCAAMSGGGSPIPRRSCGRSRRTGAVVLQFVVVMFVLLLMLLGTIEIAVLLTNTQQLGLATRVGAIEASQTGGLPTNTGDAVPSNIVEAVEQQLESSGIKLCRIVLIHNVDGTDVTLISPQTGGCECDPPEELVAPVTGDARVQLTVCVEYREMMPIGLTAPLVSFSDPNQVCQMTSTFRYEMLPEFIP